MVEFVRLRPAPFACLAGGLLLALLLPATLGWTTRALIAWDAAGLAFVAAMIVVMARADLDALRQRAEALDGGRASLLVFTLAAALVSIAAIVVEMAGAQDAGGHRGPLIALAILTIAVSWTLTHLVFALHYAHEYYAPDDDDPPHGLKFPGEDDPTYGDFAHFAFVIGCAAQTADVSITARALRRVVTAHCIAAFVFNTAIVALTINIAAGLIGGK
jgi:uncharacterized membrane protein